MRLKDKIRAISGKKSLLEERLPQGIQKVLREVSEDF